MYLNIGNHLRTKSFIGNTNEIKVKVLCHNIRVLIQEMFALGIDIKFSAQRKITSSSGIVHELWKRPSPCIQGIGGWEGRPPDIGQGNRETYTATLRLGRSGNVPICMPVPVQPLWEA